MTTNTFSVSGIVFDCTDAHDATRWLSAAAGAAHPFRAGRAVDVGPGGSVVLVVRIAGDRSGRDHCYVDAVTTDAGDDDERWRPDARCVAEGHDIDEDSDASLPIYVTDVALTTPHAEEPIGSSRVDARQDRRAPGSGSGPPRPGGARRKVLGVRDRSVASMQRITAVSDATNVAAGFDPAGSPSPGADAAVQVRLVRRRMSTGVIIAAFVALTIVAGAQLRSRPGPKAASATTATSPNSVFVNRAASAFAASQTPCGGLSQGSAKGCTDQQLTTITSPILVAACRQLTDVAAHALAVEPADYARVIGAISAHLGQSLNDAVHQQLSTARAAIARLPERAVHRSSEPEQVVGLTALDTAIAAADATPCSPQETPPRRPSSWPITEPP